MNNKFSKNWFNEGSRIHLDDFIKLELDKLTKALTDFSFYTHSGDDYIYKSAVLGGMVTSLNYIRHACVDSNGVKPWIIRKRVTHKLDFEEFRTYTGEVIEWLTKIPPNTNYAALVHTQTIIAFLTTMEFNNG